MQQKPIGLYSRILPALKRGGCAIGETEEIMVFDCRALPLGFVEETGEIEMIEAEALPKAARPKVRAPFETCYFEFNDEIALLVTECDEYSGIELTDENINGPPPNELLLGRILELYLFERWSDWSDEKTIIDEDAVGFFRNGVKIEAWGDVDPFFSVINSNNYDEYERNIRGAHFLLGTMALLNDKLLTNELRKDPAARLNKARAKRGKPPVSGDSHVLTLNVGAIRRIAQAPQGHHEPPALHWRRGHRRVLHRGSEFESETWVKRCLVGDPGRGFVRKDYRVVREMPLIMGAK